MTRINIYDPKRADYRKKIKKIIQCEFCNEKNISQQECKSLSGKFWLVLVNKYPYMDGNLIIIPKRHIKNIEQLNKEEWNEFYKILKNTKTKLSKIFKTEDFNIGINIGKKAGSSIEHMHWQILPRKEKILNSSNIFADLYIITVSPWELKKMIDKK